MTSKASALGRGGRRGDFGPCLVGRLATEPPLRRAAGVQVQEAVEQSANSASPSGFPPFGGGDS